MICQFWLLYSSDPGFQTPLLQPGQYHVRVLKLTQAQAGRSPGWRPAREAAHWVQGGGQGLGPAPARRLRLPMSSDAIRPLVFVTRSEK